jgi:hypothetical protein
MPWRHLESGLYPGSSFLSLARMRVGSFYLRKVGRKFCRLARSDNLHSCFNIFFLIKKLGSKPLLKNNRKVFNFINACDMLVFRRHAEVPGCTLTERIPHITD